MPDGNHFRGIRTTPCTPGILLPGGVGFLYPRVTQGWYQIILDFLSPATKKRCACSPRCVRLEELTISQWMTYMNQLIMVSRICWFTLPFIVPAHLCSLTKDTPFCQLNSHNKKKIVQCAHPCEPASVLLSVSISEIMIWVSQGGCCFYLFCFSVDVRLYTSVAMHCFFLLLNTV